jgi:hypothetical protein
MPNNEARKQGIDDDGHDDVMTTPYERIGHPDTHSMQLCAFAGWHAVIT